jgi:hypothetical protein
VQAQDLLVSQAFSIAVLEDVKCLIIGPGQSNRLQFVVYALSDIDRLISNARRENRREAGMTLVCVADTIRMLTI